MTIRFSRLRLAFIFVFAGAMLAQQTALIAPRPERLPQDTGAAGLDQALKKLTTTARLLQTTAHPDDEDGGMLAYEARGKGADVMLLTLTRGDGGQNKTGSNLFDELGVLRTLELLESDRYYGVQQRFTSVADFGYSKSAEETFQKWGGHEIVLADMVRVIREFRPDVVASGWSGTARDGHGHHQAAGILTPEAVHAAADPMHFPQQIKQGLLPWQVKKLYLRTRGEDYTLRLEAGKVDPDLGISYAQFGIEGYSHQKSQNASVFPAQPGPNYRDYKLVESTLPGGLAANAQERDFFDGMDTTLPGLAARLGAEENKVPFLRAALKNMAAKIDEAISTRAPEPLLEGWKKLDEMIPRVEQSTLSAEAKQDLLLNLRTKSQQFEEAARLALGLDFHVTRLQASQLLIPGETIKLTATLQNHGKLAVQLKQFSLNLPSGWKQAVSSFQSNALPLGGSASIQFTVTVPPDAKLTRPYWHRNEPDKENVHTVDDLEYQTLPLPPPPIRGRAVYETSGKSGEVHAIGKALVNGEPIALAVVPAFSVLMQHASRVVRAGQKSGMDADVIIRSNLPTASEAVVQLKVPNGWRPQPGRSKISFNSAGEEKIIHFTVFPAAPEEERTQITAELDFHGKRYEEGFSIVSREDLKTFYYYQPAAQKVSVVRVQLPVRLKVGYIMGAGDDILPALQQSGMDAQLISDQELASGNLHQFGTIVLGIRAYDTRENLQKYNQRLLEFVGRGGTLIVQNNFDVDAFNSGKYTPYPAQISRQRVSVEEAPVEILSPEDPIFNFPNKITARDFDGWIQERGVNFMSQWDEKFQPLLAASDPGEAPLKGGLLRARVGKGIYIYTGYAFFRQLPAGVPGAIRLFVNLLSAGHQP